MRPHSLPLVILGAGLLWFGWFGFNAGSALTAGGTAPTAFLDTQVAGAAAVAGWLLVERFRDGHPTTLGAASGAVAGLVAITPACGSANPGGALLIGAVAGVVCCYAVGLKYRLGYDDSLDVAGVHGVGGVLGTLLIGVLATAAVTGHDRGLAFGGGFGGYAAAHPVAAPRPRAGRGRPVTLRSQLAPCTASTIEPVPPQRHHNKSLTATR